MATESYQTQLERVQSLIAAIENGEHEERRGEREFTRADLPTLYRRETWLRKMVDRESRGGMRARKGVPLG